MIVIVGSWVRTATCVGSMSLSLDLFRPCSEVDFERVFRQDLIAQRDRAERPARGIDRNRGQRRSVRHHDRVIRPVKDRHDVEF